MVKSGQGVCWSLNWDREDYDNGSELQTSSLGDDSDSVFTGKTRNEGRKSACSTLPVSIEVTREVMVFRVSIPLVLLKCLVSLPISIYLSASTL